MVSRDSAIFSCSDNLSEGSYGWKLCGSCVGSHACVGSCSNVQVLINVHTKTPF